MNFNEFLNEGSTSEYGGPAGLTKDETLKIAQKFADAAASVDPEKGKWAVNKRTLEEDGFDLDYNDEEFDGGSYNIYKNGNVVNMAIRENPVLGKIGDDIKTIAKGFKKMMANESFLNEGVDYAVMLIGGSVGDTPRPRDAKGYVGTASTTEELYTKEKAKEKADRMNKNVLTPGEKKHYGLKYIVVPVKDGKFIKESVVNEAMSFDEIKDKYENNPYGIGAQVVVFEPGERGNANRLVFKHDDKYRRDQIIDKLKALGIPAKKLSKSTADSAYKYRYELTMYESLQEYYKSSLSKDIKFDKVQFNKLKVGDYVLSGDSVETSDTIGKVLGIKNHNVKYKIVWSEDSETPAGTVIDIEPSDKVSRVMNPEILQGVVNERNITIKRHYTDKRPAVTVGKAAKVRNKMLEAIKDGKLSQEDFNNILKEMTTDSKRWLRRNAQCFNVSEDGITLSKTGSRILKNVMIAEATTKAPKIWVPGGFDKAIAKYPNQKITRKIVLDAAEKWDVNPDDAIKYVEFGWTVDLDENKKTNDMNTKFIYESFAEFVENKLNEGTLNEAFKSAKLSNLFSVGSAGTKDLAGAFYNFSKLAIDQIEDYDIIEMDPQTARKEKRANAIYFYIVTNQKENPNIASGQMPNTWNNGIIQSNTLLAITNGNNEWYSTAYSSYSKTETLKVTKTREDAAGFDKRDSKRYDGSGITSLTKVAELADTVYVIDLDVLKARYSTASLVSKRADDKRGATAFKSDKDFKAENKSRYNQILAQKASEMPMDSIVLGAIDTLATQIKDGLSKSEKGRYGELIIGLDTKGREIKMSDASNLMRNILDEYNRYVGYAAEAEKEVATGYSGKFYEGRLKESSKTIVDYVKKVDAKNYAW